MIQRYSRAEMREIWSEQRKLEIWLQIELLAGEALCDAGLVPKRDFARMKARAAFSMERCKELETHAQPRRHCLHHQRGGEHRRARQPLAAFRPDQQRYRRHRVRRPDGAIRRTFSSRTSQALRKGDCRQGQAAPIHADDRPQPRHSCRADHVRPQDGADVRRVRPRPGPVGGGPGARGGRQTLGRRWHQRASFAAD